MDPEIKRALANIRRRRQEIERKYGKQDDDGPLFGRGRSLKNFEEEDFEEIEE